ncbi:MAG: sialate O-acetylesterase [Bacillales bacterium]|jgi:hypothetical protein|nr:sialate O-acetylesterase [Bacillales bacterium]
MGYDIIIQAGQSNAEGCGLGKSKYHYIPKDNVLYLKADFTVEKVKDDEEFSNFSLSFADKYLENGYLKEGRKLLIIRGAVGATGFKNGHWGLNDPLYLHLRKLIDFSLKGENNKLVALLWHQGEDDIDQRLMPQEYHNYLFNLFTSLRTAYDSSLPIITADLVKEWRSLKEVEPYYLPIKKEIIKVIKEIKNADFVNTDDLLSNNQTIQNGDTIHFSRQAQHLLGQRLFEAFQKLIK